MKRLLRTIWAVLKFEAVCKLLVICFIYPVLYSIYQIYAASEGLNFNGGVVSAFFSPAGVIVLLLVAAGATVFVFWELTTIVRIAALTRQGQTYTSIWDCFPWRGLAMSTA